MIKYVAFAVLFAFTACHRDVGGALPDTTCPGGGAVPSYPTGSTDPGTPCGDVGEACCVPIDPGPLCNEGLYCDSDNICEAPDMAELVDMSVNLDLSMPADLSTPPDLTQLVDLSTPPDLTAPPDMTVLPDLSVVADMTVLPDMTCVPTILNPTVELLIDRSGSMTTTDCTVTSGTCPAGTTAGKCGGGKNAPAGCVNNLSRWGLVKYALTDSTVGVLTALQSQVLFGATLFSGPSGACPSLITTDETPALNNAATISALLAANSPSGNTPTAQAVASTSAYVQSLTATAKFIVLATDGLPNTCSSQTDDTPNTVAAITAAYNAGITTYVLGVGPDTSDANLQAMANAGQGVSTGAVFYKGTSPSDLVAAFNAIIWKARGCQ